MSQLKKPFKQLSVVATLCVVALYSSNVFAFWPVVVDGESPQVSAQNASAYASAIGPSVGASNATTVTTPLLNAIGAMANGLNSTLTSALQTISQSQQQQNSAIAAQTYASKINQQFGAGVGSTGRPADACPIYSQAAYATPNAQGASYNASVAKYGGAVRAGNAPSQSDQKRVVQDTHFNKYCDKNTDPNQCASAPPAETNGAGDVMTGADQRSSTLFDGAGSPGRVANHTFTTRQQSAAQDMISNVIDGTSSPRKLSKAEYLTPQGQQYEGLRIAYEARMSLARDTLESSLALRTPINGSNAAVTALINSNPTVSNYVTNKLNGIKKYSPSGDVSPLDLLSIEVGMRADNPDWVLNINTGADPNAVNKDIAMMLALQLKMQFMQLEQGERIASLDAITSAENAKRNIGPQLDAAEMAVVNGAVQK